MRIRQVRPEFFTDATMAALPPEVRLTYIGLWIVADDAGYLKWDISQIGAVLFPYESVKRREKHLALAADRLEAAGRLVRYECGCALIPTLSRHQRVTGKTSMTARDAHGKHLPLTGKQVVSDSGESVLGKRRPLTGKQVVAPVMVGNGNGRERNGSGTVGREETSDDGLSEFQRKYAAAKP